MKQKLNSIILVSFLFINTTFAQLPDSCKLNIGTNLSGVSDYGTELPFVDMMHSCRVFYSQDANNPDGGPFNTEATDSMTFRPDGYPTHIPQTIPGRPFTQKISTIWAFTAGWTPGQYVVLFDGTGTLSFWGGFTNLTQTSPNRLVFDLDNSSNDMIQMSIDSSDIADPIRNIRVLIPGTENTYSTHPFNPLWLSKALVFKSFRFMDWGSTNNWGQDQPWEWDSPVLYDWNERQQMDHYTWADNKGIPYEMMILLMNEFDVDGWVCVPHRSSNNYIQNMAQLFHAQLEPQRKLTVEYSNEIWNWMFGQTQWCLAYGSASSGLPWPECTVQYIQNCMDIWTSEYTADLDKITRAVGIQTGWLDVAQRVAFNMTPNSFDAIAATYYFGLGESADSALDILGASATTSDIAYWARYTRNIHEKIWMQDIKTTIADSLNKKMVFYEGGQHLTPTPFGEEPTYAQALLEIQRDTAIYNLYNEWYDFVRTLQTGDTPLQLMNFSFVGGRSARYGSWGILETMDQDTSLIPAPKYQSTFENMAKECISKTWTGTVNNHWNTTGNWTPSGTPGVIDNVLIPSGSVVMPVINTTEANCNNLVIDKNAILSIESGMTLTVNGNLIIIYE
jgi:hypothetical protein